MPGRSQYYAVLAAQWESLPQSQYFTAFGTDGRYFFRTPAGYAAANLPPEVMQRIGSGSEKEVLFASFSDDPQRWFVTYKDRDGIVSHHFGPTLPPKLLRFCEVRRSLIKRKDSNTFRIQYGNSGAYVAWSPTEWISHKLPDSLLRYLSWASQEVNLKGNGGTFRTGCPEMITWHADGTFFVMGKKTSTGFVSDTLNYHVYDFATSVVQDGWNQFWGIQEGDPTREQLQQLTHVAINPHSSSSESYVFIKRSQKEKEPDFILRFAAEEPISRLSAPDDRMQASSSKKRDIQWVRAKQSGRPHPRDDWELQLKKNEMLKILDDKGKDWVIVQNSQGEKGYAHKSFLDYNYRRNIDSKTAYFRFKADTNKLFERGSITCFPDLSLYVHCCRKDACKKAKKAEGPGLGICKHELETLLRGSGHFSHAFLREERNKWHPDRFGRLCDPNHQTALTKQSEKMFVLMSILMEDIEQAWKERTED